MIASSVKKTVLVTCLLNLSFLGGCGLVYVDPPFEGGIRIITLETSLELGLADVPVPGVLDQGTLINVLGSGSGYQSTFGGTTNSGGYDDHTSARTNAYWLFSADYTNPSPDCGLVSAYDTIPAAGAEHSFHCIL